MKLTELNLFAKQPGAPNEIGALLPRYRNMAGNKALSQSRLSKKPGCKKEGSSVNPSYDWPKCNSPMFPDQIHNRDGNCPGISQVPRS